MINTLSTPAQDASETEGTTHPMHPLLIAALGLITYAVGFAITARIAWALAERPISSIDTEFEAPMIAMFWPIALALLIVIAPFALLYRLATKGLPR